MFRIAGDRTSVAADAFSIINDKAILHTQLRLDARYLSIG